MHIEFRITTPCGRREIRSRMSDKEAATVFVVLSHSQSDRCRVSFCITPELSVLLIDPILYFQSHTLLSSQTSVKILSDSLPTFFSDLLQKILWGASWNQKFYGAVAGSHLSPTGPHAKGSAASLGCFHGVAELLKCGSCGRKEVRQRGIPKEEPETAPHTQQTHTRAHTHWGL